jgi:DNA-binding MarR family transcriptional regulator
MQEINFESTLTYLMARLMTAYRNALEQSMIKIDLHGGQVFVLIELWSGDGIRQVDIARRLSLSAPTVNKIVKGLAEINLVEVTRLSDDGRASRIFLTDKGMAMRKAVSEQWLELEAEYLSGLNETERHILPVLLKKLKLAYLRTTDADDED